MAKPGDVVRRGTGSSPTIKILGPIIVPGISLSTPAAPTTAVRDINLDGSNQIQTQDSATSTTGRYMQKESFEQITEAEVTDAAITGPKIADSSVSAAHTVNNVRRRGVCANASFTQRRTV